MNIAICDDDINAQKKIQTYSNEIFKEIKENIEILVFNDGESIINAIQKENKYFDIILLDVDMPDVSGLKVAKILREIDNNIIIIFISSYEKYVFDSLEYNPFRYIRKICLKEELPIALKSAYSLYKKRKKKYIIIKNDDGEYKIEESEICYCEIVKRKLYIHLSNNRVLGTWKSIRDFYEEISGGTFVKIHSGCAVNMKYVKEYSNYYITLDNGEKLLTSRAGIKTLKEALSRYWSECV